MSPCAWAAVLACCASAGITTAADLGGSIIIERKLTRRSVTAPAPGYQRGAAVELGGKPPVDPLAFERSHVVVYLEGDGGATPGHSAPSHSAPGGEPVSIEQQDRQFVPDLVVVPAGSSVSFPNMDAIFHNVFSLSKPKSFDLGNYSKGQTRTVMFPTPGVVYVYCHLHPNMAASIVVTPNQWSTKVDGEGHFHLADVPPGKYTAIAWHKTAGFFRQTIHVTEDGAPALRFVIPFAADPAEKSAANR